MLRTMLIWLMACAAHGASAQSLYKCTVDGKVSYSVAPCKQGTMKAIEVPPAPPRDPAREKELKREQAALAQLQSARLQREEQELRGLTPRADNAFEQRCAKLRTQKQWADDNAERAPGANKAALRKKARRLGESIAAECGS
jgi:hypothetical protein